MTIRFLVDTNVLSEPVRPSPHPGVLARLREHGEEIATAALVWNELLFGYERLPPSRKREAIGTYLFRTVRKRDAFRYVSDVAPDSTLEDMESEEPADEPAQQHHATSSSTT